MWAPLPSYHGPVPELPDIEAYRTAIERVAGGQVLEQVRLRSPFLLRSVEPPLAAATGRRLETVGRLGKRLVFGLEGKLFLVLHLMIAGRLRWRKAGASIPSRAGLAALDWPHGTLLLTEASGRKRASLHVVAGREALEQHDPGGVEPLDAPPEAVAVALRSRRHTLKRALTDPRILSGIGNAYSDEILHRARLSPFRLTDALDDQEIGALVDAIREVLGEWTDRLVAAARESFPEKVTAFRESFAVHGRYGKPCPDCGQPVQRIAYAQNEANYCAACQTGGRLLRDRALSRLLKSDWPRTLEELEQRLGRS